MAGYPDIELVNDKRGDQFKAVPQRKPDFLGNAARQVSDKV
jgi:hypothetical protein